MKRHLCVGINAYFAAPLNGCVNDARDWDVLLNERGSQGKILLDGAATRAGIIGGLADLIASTHFGDTAVFTYSGHGTWVPDADGDEADRRDEALVPYDYETAGLITDDVLYNVVQQFKHFGGKILFISDSCHSGSVERLFHQNATGARRTRFLNPALTLRSERMIEVAKTVEMAPTNPTSRTGAALLSGCRDDEVSWDIDFDGRPNGALTRAAIDAFRAYEPTSLTQWQAYILERIQADQTPQVQGTYVQRRRTQFI